MNIFTWIISPLELLLRTLLDFFYVLTTHYGIAIVLLSMSINILLLPVYLLAERLQDKEIAIKNKMRRKLEEINRTFQGQERFMMTHTLYKIHSYHPIMGLRSLGSLLIQILFFFTAYELLKHFQAFQGVSFLFIQDLSKPDALLSLGRLPLNVLPLIMTVINIIAAQIYARRKNPQALLSAWGMALVFLLLLYQSSAALVLYWICNNIFTLIKNLLLAYKMRNAQESLPSTYSLLKERVVTFLAQDTKFINTIFFLWGLGAYFFLSYKMTVPYQIIPMLFIIPGILLSIAALLLLFKHAQQYNNMHTKIATICYITLSLAGIICLMFFIIFSIQEIDTYTTSFKRLGILFLCSPNLFFLPMVYKIKFHRSTIPKSRFLKKNQWYVISLSILSTILLLFFALPIRMYADNYSEILIDFSLLVRTGFLLGGVVVAILVSMSVGAYLLSRLFSRNIVFYVGVGIVVLSFMLITYALLIPFNMGPMNNFTLLFPQRLTPALLIYVIEGLGIAVYAYYIIHYFKKHPTTLLFIHTIFIAILMFQIVQSSIVTSTLPSPLNSSQISDSHVSEGNMPETAQSTFSFSRKHQNILVILLDMANGGYIQRIMQEDETFITRYQGFTWYPNSLSISTRTGSSLPSMLGGWGYTPDTINNREGENVQYKMNVAYNSFINTFLTHNYDIALTSSLYSYAGGCNKLIELGAMCLDEKEILPYINYWVNRHPTHKKYYSGMDDISLIKSSTSNKIILIQLSGLLRSIPISFKNKLYNEGKWIFSTFFALREVYETALNQWAIMDSLDTISTVREVRDTHNTIKFIHSQITHDRYALSASCRLERERYPDPTVQDSIYGDNAYNSLQCTLDSLSRLFHWMQEQGIYDNTKIILVSDHGSTFDEDPMNTAGITPEIFEVSKDKRKFLFNRIHALFMIKDFNSQGEMEIDNRFLSNADLSAILFHSIEGYVPHPNSLADDKIDPIHSPPRSRILPTFNTEHYTREKTHQEKRQIAILSQYEVKDNMFVPQNWKKILP